MKSTTPHLVEQSVFHLLLDEKLFPPGKLQRNHPPLLVCLGWLCWLWFLDVFGLVAASPWTKSQLLVGPQAQWFDAFRPVGMAFVHMARGHRWESKSHTARIHGKENQKTSFQKLESILQYPRILQIVLIKLFRRGKLRPVTSPPTKEGQCDEAIRLFLSAFCTVFFSPKPTHGI